MSGPVAIPYKRWKSKAKSYVVTVTAVTYKRGTKAEVTYVTFTDGKKTWSWSSEAFLRAFDPVGRKLRPKTVWQLLLGKDPF